VYLVFFNQILLGLFNHLRIVFELFILFFYIV